MVRDQGFKVLEPVDRAIEKMMKKLRTLGIENVSIYNCVGRVLARDIIAEFEVPEFDKSAMDGYAVKAEDTFGSSQTNPAILRVIGKIEVGEIPEIEIKKGEAVRVFTGSAIPKGADAVIMLEHTREEGNFVQIFKSLPPFKNVIKKGEDIRKGDLILKRGEILQPQDAGLLASLGFEFVEVYKKPRVSVISTGNELIPPGKKREIGKIYNSNNPMICNALKELDFPVFSLGIAKDRAEEIEKKLLKALEFDAVIFTGGTSVGSHDLVPEIVEKYGEIVFHGVAMKPGLPTAFGIVREKPVFMLPGSPAATFLSFHTFVVPALFRMMNVRILERKWSKKKGILQSRLASEIGIRSNVRVFWKNGKIYPVKISGSGILTSIVSTNAILVIPENFEGYETGEEVEVTLFRDITEVFE
ncbi:MAG: molybdopterin molybdotransferase MoeA [Archaeoglobaceae archaeon]|nr:molybdopterin molybdotransferase MoeA [Archaeoglobaceae archaeon]MDW7989931.1 molybdopterin molybdotransferase MoeA [Archaeoglobaceae archaeon]